MKKYLLPLAAGLVLVGCVNQDIIDDGLNSADEVKARNFLNISIIPASNSATRADAAPGTYEDGDESEGQVNLVRFYFFNEDGNATPVWENRGTGSYNSYLDWVPAASDVKPGDETETVETVLKTTLGIVSPANYAKPTGVVAVVNPTSNILNLSNNSTIQVGSKDVTLNGPSLEELCEITDNYLTNLYDKNFVMSNSVYVNSDNDIINYTAISENNYGTVLPDDNDREDNTQDDGTTTSNAPDPVTIYVERVLARLDFGLSLETMKPNDKGLYEAGSYVVGADATEPTTIYVKFSGWNVTGTTNESRLMKSVSTDWTTDNLFGGSTLNGPWTTADYHRSFWALNPESLEHEFGAYDDVDDDMGVDDTGANAPVSEGNVNPATLMAISAPGDFTTTYLQENANAFNADGTGGDAAPAAPEYASKVIIAAQLCDEDGNPFSLAEWNYHKFKAEDMLTYFAQNVLNNLYWDSTPEPATPEETPAKTYTKISASDLAYATAEQLGMETEDPRFYVYVILSDTGMEKDWYLFGAGQDPTTGNVTGTAYTDEQVNQYISDAIHHLRVWTNGMTYYYFDVKHLGAPETPAYYGIVRNHIYRTTVTGVTGLGTPVYDPDQIIIPEQNTYSESIITADVKVLQWRVVSSDYNLVWK